MEMRRFLKNAANVKPTKRQLTWFDREFYAFVHFGVNSVTGREWGTGEEDPTIFNPSELDCDEWVEAVKSASMRAIILTATHPDGFCLWPSKYTEHCVKNSPFRNGKGDVVKELSEACARGGIGMGIYLSPWDRNSKLYGTDAYNDYYKAQLTELMTNYGEIVQVWFDGACGEGPNGKKQVYDYDGYIDIIRRYQPNAAIFSNHGPDVRCCGNEAGYARHEEWAVVPYELCNFCTKPQTEGALVDGDLSYMLNSEHTLGSLCNILYSKGLVFAGTELDTSIRDGWFHHPEEEPKSLEHLMQIYLNSVGHNATLNLNIPPMANGRFDPRDIARLKELGEAIKKEFGNPLATVEFPQPIEALSETQVVYHIDLPKGLPEESLRWICLEEDLRFGQRVESFGVYYVRNGERRDWTNLVGRTIGHKQICRMEGFRENDTIDVVITSARDTVHMRRITVY
ncbi:MAG: alpha-L-fucosidase [Clostridia bacterium]|nr:alpha-L-fucosidase [Clostridia bacterium]